MSCFDWKPSRHFTYSALYAEEAEGNYVKKLGTPLMGPSFLLVQGELALQQQRTITAETGC